MTITCLGDLRSLLFDARDLQDILPAIQQAHDDQEAFYQETLAPYLSAWLMSQSHIRPWVCSYQDSLERLNLPIFEVRPAYRDYRFDLCRSMTVESPNFLFQSRLEKLTACHLEFFSFGGGPQALSHLQLPSLPYFDTVKKLQLLGSREGYTFSPTLKNKQGLADPLFLGGSYVENPWPSLDHLSLHLLGLSKAASFGYKSLKKLTLHKCAYLRDNPEWWATNFGQLEHLEVNDRTQNILETSYVFAEYIQQGVFPNLKTCVVDGLKLLPLEELSHD